MPKFAQTSPAQPLQGQEQRGLLREHHLDALENWLDRKFVIPGTGIRFGLDGLLGLVPGIGDAATAALSGLLVADAYAFGARKRVLLRMAGNILLDFVLGAVPVVGDLFDFAFKSNTKNLVLLREERRRMEDIGTRR